MRSILLKAGEVQIRFHLYEDVAPQTCEAFCRVLPFEINILHARVSGEEIWAPEAPALDVIQENATIYPEPGEIVIAPLQPVRNKVTKCIGVFYGKGQLLDCANIFARAWPEDMEKLKKLGEEIWMKGARIITFDMA